eukprot:2207089-Pleurochrysis_carterae.AAC.2
MQKCMKEREPCKNGPRSRLFGCRPVERRWPHFVKRTPEVRSQSPRLLLRMLERVLEQPDGQCDALWRGEPQPKVCVDEVARGRLARLVKHELELGQPVGAEVAVEQHHPPPERPARLNEALRERALLAARARGEMHVEKRLQPPLAPERQDLLRRVGARIDQEQNRRAARRASVHRAQARARRIQEARAQRLAHVGGDGLRARRRAQREAQQELRKGREAASVAISLVHRSELRRRHRHLCVGKRKPELCVRALIAHCLQKASERR